MVEDLQAQAADRSSWACNASDRYTAHQQRDHRGHRGGWRPSDLEWMDDETQAKMESAILNGFGDEM